MEKDSKKEEKNKVPKENLPQQDGFIKTKHRTGLSGGKINKEIYHIHGKKIIVTR
ncbi:hypothetical protein KKH36_01360 [Patescibacteria group bacterium]|nr:hypothetical protein [Patescibacteria group bacterium]